MIKWLFYTSHMSYPQLFHLFILQQWRGAGRGPRHSGFHSEVWGETQRASDQLRAGIEFYNNLGLQYSWSILWLRQNLNLGPDFLFDPEYPVFRLKLTRAAVIWPQYAGLPVTCGVCLPLIGLTQGFPSFCNPPNLLPNLLQPTGTFNQPNHYKCKYSTQCSQSDI